jgi:hypothetical protein
LLLSKGHEKLLTENADNLAALFVVLLPLTVSRRWAQWVGLSLLIIVNVIFLILFDAAFEYCIW